MPVNILALDVGERRIGLAIGDVAMKIAVPRGHIEVTGSEIDQLKRLVETEQVATVVIGYPRNQSGEATAQTAVIGQFAERLQRHVALPVVFQDESLSSVMAEQRLQALGKPYGRGDIDAEAACIILQDYLDNL